MNLVPYKILNEGLKGNEIYYRHMNDRCSNFNQFYLILSDLVLSNNIDDYFMLLDFQFTGEAVIENPHLIMQLYMELTEKIKEIIRKKDLYYSEYIQLFAHLVPLFNEIKILFSDKEFLNNFISCFFLDYSSFDLILIHSLSQSIKGSIIIQEKIFKKFLFEIEICKLDLLDTRQILKIIYTIFCNDSQMLFLVDYIQNIYIKVFTNESYLAETSRLIKYNYLFKIFIQAKVYLSDNIIIDQNCLSIIFDLINDSYKCLLNFMFVTKQYDNNLITHLFIIMEKLLENQVSFKYQYKWYSLIKQHYVILIKKDLNKAKFLINRFYVQAPIDLQNKIKKKKYII